MSRVSIIIPVYNSEKYLYRCLNSVMQQTYKDYKVVIVNDGSIDNSFKIISKFKEKHDDRIQIIQQSNSGVQKSRINGLNKSNGEYVCFVDSDDYIEQNYIENLYNTLKETSTNISCSRFKFHFNQKFLKEIPFRNKERPREIDLELQKEFLPKINVVSTAKLFKREYVEFPKQNFEANEDLSINYCAFVLAKNISNANNTAYHYCPNNDGLVSKKINGDITVNLKNTINPLNELRQSFIDRNIYDEYMDEIEAIYIKNLFETLMI